MLQQGRLFGTEDRPKNLRSDTIQKGTLFNQYVLHKSLKRWLVEHLILVLHKTFPILRDKGDRISCRHHDARSLIYMKVGLAQFFGDRS